MQRSLVTRLLHMLLALAVIHQLVAGALMRAPRHGAPGDVFWQAHQAAGIASLGILFAFWAWTLLRSGETRLAALFPWFTVPGRAALHRDALGHIATLRHLRLPHRAHSPIAGAVHGLGLLAATGMALTGASYFLQGVLPDPVVRLALNLHSLLATAMWAYLIAHAGLAVLHEVTGQRVLRRMSPLVPRLP